MQAPLRDRNGREDAAQKTSARPDGRLSRRSVIKSAIKAAPVVLLLTTRSALAQGSGTSGEGSE